MQEPPAIPGVSIRRRIAVDPVSESFLGDLNGLACVVKRLLPSAGAMAREALRREAEMLETLLALGSRHIVKVYRSGPDWLVLEHIDGLDLEALLARRKRGGPSRRPLPVGIAQAIAVALARALEALAICGFVHGDIHPGNVLLSSDGRVVLTGFGGRFVDASAASDLYQAGLLSYACFTGRWAERALPSSLRPELQAHDRVLTAPRAADPERRPTAAQWRTSLEMVGHADSAALGALVRSVSVDTIETQAASDEIMPPFVRPSRRTALAIGAVAGVVGAVAWVLSYSGEAQAPVQDATVREVVAEVVTVETVTPEVIADTVPEPEVTELATHAPRRVGVNGLVNGLAGAVEVRTASSRGMAPWLSSPLADGGALVMTITGGMPPLSATVEIAARDGRLQASIRSPEGALRVTCGKDTTATPTKVELTEGCRLVARDRGTLAFELVDRPE